MGSSSPPKQNMPEPIAMATGPDQARIAEEARRRQARAYDFSKTILAPQGYSTSLPANTKSTLG
jgi:hypothetical protein